MSEATRVSAFQTSLRGLLRLRADERGLVVCLVLGALACWSTGTGFSFWRVIYNYMAYFSLYYMLLFMIARFAFHAEGSPRSLSRYGSSEQLARADYELARGGLFFFVAMAVYTNVKVRVPLLNGFIGDSYLYHFERAIFGSAFLSLGRIIQSTPWLDTFLTEVYLGDFLFVAFGALFLHLRADIPRLRELFYGSSFLYLIGIFWTALCPTYGPFVADAQNWAWVQKGFVMGKFQNTLVNGLLHTIEAGRTLSEARVAAGAGVAAFPSLHIAQLSLVVLITWVSPGLRWFAWLTITGSLITLVATLGYGWHYFMDAPGGVLLAYCCLRLTRWLNARETAAAVAAPSP